MFDFIFMLTRNDQTVANAMEVYADIRDTELRYVGFKDIGLPTTRLRELASAMRADGREVFLEVVSERAEDEIRSVEASLEIGVDWLLGGTHPDVRATVPSPAPSSATRASSKEPSQRSPPARESSPGVMGCMAWTCLPTAGMATFHRSSAPWWTHRPARSSPREASTPRSGSTPLRHLAPGPTRSAARSSRRAYRLGLRSANR